MLWSVTDIRRIAGMDTILKDTVPNGHNPEWTQSRMNTIPNGHNPEWTQSQMDTITTGQNPEWTPSRMDEIPNGHNPEWTLSRMSTYLVTKSVLYAILVRSFYKDACNKKLIFYVM